MKELNDEDEAEHHRQQQDNEEQPRSEKRSASVDSSKFQSPKRAAKSQTPDLVAAVAAQ